MTSNTPDDPKGQNSVRANLDPAVVARYRDAYAEMARTQKAWGNALHEKDAAQTDFAQQVWAVARWRVRSLHPDWFHENGNKRGEFRKQIDGAVRSVANTLWRGVVADDWDAPGPSERHAQLVKHYYSPEQEEARRAQHREKMLRELEEEIALDGDPKRAATLRRTLPIALDTPIGTEAHNKAWKVYLETRKKLTQMVCCNQCGEEQRELQSVVRDSRTPVIKENGKREFVLQYVCEACRTKERREKLAAGRRERHAAQRRANFHLQQNPKEEE